jgi:DmsE family decaheme c-type cytochrome
MKLLRKLFTWCVAVGALTCASSALAADAPQDLVLKGDAACTACHDDSDGPELLAIGKTRHGTTADTRTPTCTSCHGSSKDHLGYKGSGKPPKPDITFDAKSASSTDARNGACQDCHTKDTKRSHWEGSTHQARDVTCAACHKVHVAKDKVRDKATQPEVCYACHKEQRTLANKPSHHPVAEGKMACSDCHNVHGSTGPSLMKRNSVTETCYTCHMEKRGPFVHSHQPVAEDCSICHNPHGTTAESMLKTRAPFLCNSCHTPHGPIQPTLTNGTAPTIAAPGWWSPSVITQGKSCVSCHSQIHGSNNPSSAGQRFFR